MLATVADGKIVAERWGEGDPSVIALHGWGRGRLDWVPILSHLDALAPDLPGFGLTPAPTSVWGSADYARSLLNLLDGTPKVIVGHSFGGRVALHLAIMAPDQVRSLVLTGVPLLRTGPTRGPALPFRIAKALSSKGLLSEARMDAFRNRYGSQDYRAASGVMRNILVKLISESYDEDIRNISCPVELVWGEHDNEVPLSIARSATGQFRHANLTVVPDAAHLLTPEFTLPLQKAIGTKDAPL